MTFAVGAVTGTVLSFEFGLLWPAFTGRFGEVFGVLFAIEGIFFFLEAIFIAIYIFGWKHLSPWTHFWSGVPVVIAGLGGAFSVVAVNSWMNQPQGFSPTSGDVTSVEPLKVRAGGWRLSHLPGLGNVGGAPRHGRARSRWSTELDAGRTPWRGRRASKRPLESGSAQSDSRRLR